MCFIYIQVIHAQFFKRNYLIFFLFLIQFFQPCLQCLSGLFNLFDGITSAILFIPCTLNCHFQIINLLP